MGKIQLGSDEMMKRLGLSLKEKKHFKTKEEAREYAGFILDFENKHRENVRTTIFDDKRGYTVKVWKVI
jgi:protein-tyrosine-phosphatase